LRYVALGPGAARGAHARGRCLGAHALALAAVAGVGGALQDYEHLTQRARGAQRKVVNSCKHLGKAHVRQHRHGGTGTAAATAAACSFNKASSASASASASSSSASAAAAAASDATAAAPAKPADDEQVPNEDLDRVSHVAQHRWRHSLRCKHVRMRSRDGLSCWARQVRRLARHRRRRALEESA
jgi:hypothetical protein